MYAAIVTVILPGEETLIPGTGAMLSRDHIETGPIRTEVYKLRFKTEKALKDWLVQAQTITKLL